MVYLYTNRSICLKFNLIKYQRQTLRHDIFTFSTVAFTFYSSRNIITYLQTKENLTQAHSNWRHTWKEMCVNSLWSSRLSKTKLYSSETILRRIWTIWWKALCFLVAELSSTYICRRVELNRGNFDEISSKATVRWLGHSQREICCVR